MAKIKVGINGFGRIGRGFFHSAQEVDDIEIVGINDLGDVENLAYLLRFDSVYGHAPFEVSYTDTSLIIDGVSIPVSHEKDPAHIPWKTVGADIIVESTGVFTDYEKAQAHIAGGAKRVVVTGPGKGDPSIGKTILVGVNEADAVSCKITSNASCTTNAASPLVAILDHELGIEKALLNTVHAYTATQMTVDGPGGKKDMRRGRAAAINIVPSSTGAAHATAEAHTQLKDKFDGISLRVPVPAGSIADITFIAKRETTVEEVNDILTKAASRSEWNGIFTVTEDELVSSDIVGNPHACIADLTMTRVIGNLVKVLGWYDNEMGYVHTLVRHVQLVGKHL